MAWRMFTVAALDLMGTAEPCRAALDDALRDTLAQLRLGMMQFATRAKQGSNSRRAMHWADGLDLVNRSIVLAAALLDKYTKGLNSGMSSSARTRISCSDAAVSSVIPYSEPIPGPLPGSAGRHHPVSDHVHTEPQRLETLGQGHT